MFPDLSTNISWRAIIFVEIMKKKEHKELIAKKTDFHVVIKADVLYL